LLELHWHRRSRKGVIVLANNALQRAVSGSTQARVLRAGKVGAVRALTDQHAAAERER